MDSSNMMVIYHGDRDGFCAAYVLRKANPFAEFVRMNEHGDPPPDVTGKDVVVVDYSFDRETTEGLAEQANSFLNLDHHATTEDLLGDLPYVFIDQSKSGAHLAYDLVVGCPVPSAQVGNWLVRYVEDQDLWLWLQPDSKEVNAALSSYPLDFTVWETIEERGLDSLIEEGRHILRFKDKQIEHIVSNARDVAFQGYVIPTANSPIFGSEVGNILSRGRDFAIVWSITSDGSFKYELRSAEDGENVQKIAEANGGGGHPHAAGFKSSQMLF